MRRKRMRFDRFMVTLFTCHAGEERIIPPGELNRGISDTSPIDDLLAAHPTAKLLTPITIFTKGSFVSINSEGLLRHITAGDGGWRVAKSESLDNFRLRACEDDSEYHCLFPLDRAVRYWHRKPVNCHAGDSVELKQGQMLYVATGTVDVAGHRFTGPAMVESSRDQAAEIIERAIGVITWT